MSARKQRKMTAPKRTLFEAKRELAAERARGDLKRAAEAVRALKRGAS